MSATPRTDDQIGYNGSTDSCIRIEFVRKLEKELHSMAEECDELREEVKSLKESIRDQEHHIMELERLRRYSPGPHMGQD